MLNSTQLEDAYKKYMGNLQSSAHDGVLDVDLSFLYGSGLLSNLPDEQHKDAIMQYFQVIETAEKVTLHNEQFLIWITPKVDGYNSTTYVLIASIHQNAPTLEVAFTCRGIYNTPRFVLNILQHFLLDMMDTEATISAMEEAE